MKKSRVLLLGLCALMLFPVLAFADTISDASNSLDAQWALVQKFGPIWGGMLFGYLLAQKLLAKYKADHPVAQGRTLALITSAVGVFGTLLVMHFDGGSSAGLLVTLLGAGKLMSSPTITKSGPVMTPSSSGQGGFVRIDMLVITASTALIGGAFIITACQTPNVKNAEHAGLSTAEACAKQSGLQIISDDGKPLLSAVSDAILKGAGQTAIDQGIAIADAELKQLPSTLEADAINCAIHSAIAAWAPLTNTHGFAGGDARLTMASQIGQALLAKYGATPQ